MWARDALEVVADRLWPARWDVEGVPAETTRQMTDFALAFREAVCRRPTPTATVAYGANLFPLSRRARWQRRLAREMRRRGLRPLDEGSRQDAPVRA